MKSLHVETGRHLYGGAQQVLYLVRGLAQRNEEAVLVCPPGSEIAVAARSDGIAVIEAPCGGDLDLRFAWRLRQHLLREAPDIVHCHSRRGADFLGGQAAAMAGIPAVVSRRVDNADAPFIARLRYRKFRRIVAISEAIAQELRRSGIAAERISLIHSAVDIERFRDPPSREALCREFGVEVDDQLVVSAGQLIPRKGQRYLLEALAGLKDSHPRLRALLFGRGPEQASLQQLATELDLNEVVTFAGFRDDLDDWLGGFDVLVHTALAEGLGVIVLKAQAAGMPVVAFEAGGVPEIISHGENGLLVPPADSAALAMQLAALLDDSHARGRYASGAQKTAASKFSIDAMVDAHVALYRDILRDD